jgi:TonB-dependent receptor
MFHGYIKRLAALLFLSGLILQLSAAQSSGTIKGTVYDRATKDQLPGANVVVRGTSIGTSTSLSGEYIIRNAPGGQQTIRVTYIGYISQSVVVNVPEGGSITQDVNLSATTLEGEEIVVTAQAQGQLQAINQQLASDKIVNIVSESRIQELPDFNAAQAISRLPGVSTLQSSGEANKVVIRGLAPQYNSISIGGITLAPTGETKIGVSSNTDLDFASINSDRSVDLTMVSPYMIKSISVYKSLTPDLDANAIGGVVDMELREAPSGYRADVLWQSGYTAKTKSYGNYRFVASASNRFFDDDFGVYVLANVEEYDRSSDDMGGEYLMRNVYPDSTGFAPVFVRRVDLTRHLETRQRYGGNLILDYRLPFGTLRMNNLLSRLNSDYQDYRTRLDYQNHNIDYTYREGKRKTDLGLSSLEAAMDFAFLSVNLKAAVNYSRNHDPDSYYFVFRETGGVVGNVPDNVLPENLLPLIRHEGPGNVYLNTLNLFNTDYKENDQVYKADFRIPLNTGSEISAFVKFGGEHRYNGRKNEQSTPYARIDRGSNIQNWMVDSLINRFSLGLDSAANRFPGTNFTSSDPKLYESFLDNRFGSLYWLPTAGVLSQMTQYVSRTPSFNAIFGGGTNPGGWFAGPFEYLANYYEYVEKYYAAYLMAEVNIGPDIRVVGGARYEEIKSVFNAFNIKDGRDPGSQQAFAVSATPANNYLLPMVQVKYDVTDWMDIRYSFTKTLARPDFHQLTPHFYMDFSRNNVWAGNPRLKPGQSLNHDVILTFHSNDLGLLSVGGFYKTVKEFTYFTRYKLHQSAVAGLDSIGTYEVGGVFPQDGALLRTYLNSPYDATVKGIEVDFQTRFWYLPPPLDGVVFGMNYTHIWSDATYPWRDDRTSLNPNPPPRFLVTTIDSTREGRLIDQPDDIFNAYIGYDYEGFSGRISVVFQGNSVSGIGNFPEQDGFTKDYFRVDASARQKLPVEGLQLFLDLNNINARKNSSAQLSIGGFTSELNYGLTANLGLRYIL